MANNGSKKMFVGLYIHAIDAKNRIFIPSQFRRSKPSKNPYIISRGLEKCLYLFESERWGDIIGKFENLSWSDKTAQRAFKRMLLAGAVETYSDSHGRLLLPSHLMEYAGIKDEVAVVGMGDRLEIWDSGRWKAYSSGLGEKSFRALAEKLDI